MTKLLAVTLLAALECTPVVAQTNVTGTFYHGHGRGKNAVLETQTNGQYSAKWSDCLGACPEGLKSLFMLN